jgi:NTE family protein
MTSPAAAPTSDDAVDAEDQRDAPPATADDDVYRTLVVGGGGIRGVSALGAAARLADAGLLADVDTFVGTSAGALVCAVLAVRRDVREVMAVLEREKYAPDYDLAGIGSKYGLDSGRHLASWIHRILGARYTFAEVRARFGTTLVVCATDLTRRRAAYLGPDTHPDMDVGLALRATCAVPLYFAAVRTASGGLYVDGALMDNFPLAWARAHTSRGRALGVCIRGDDPAPITSLDTYVGALVDCIVQTDHDCADADDSDVVYLRAPPDIGTLHLSLSPPGLARLFDAGRAQAERFLASA